MATALIAYFFAILFAVGANYVLMHFMIDRNRDQ
jgi:hypothetical protein